MITPLALPLEDHYVDWERGISPYLEVSKASYFHYKWDLFPRLGVSKALTGLKVTTLTLIQVSKALGSLPCLKVRTLSEGKGAITLFESKASYLDWKWGLFSCLQSLEVLSVSLYKIPFGNYFRSHFMTSTFVTHSLLPTFTLKHSILVLSPDQCVLRRKFFNKWIFLLK